MKPSQFFTLHLIVSLFLLLVCWVQPALSSHENGNDLSQPIREKWAVIVAISQFQDPNVPALSFATKDANLLAKVLKDPSSGHFATSHLVTLFGSSATKASIEETVSKNWLLKKALPNDLIYLFFYTRTTPNAAGDDVYLYTYDTPAADASHSGISLKETMRELKRRTQSHRILAVLCTAPFSPAAYPGIDKLSAATGVSFFTSNLLSRPAIESPPGATLFTHHLLEALKIAGGLAPLNTVAQYVTKNVQEQGQKSSPALYLALDNQDLGMIPLGIPVKSAAAPSNFGHPVGSLPLTRPDLAQKSIQHPPAAEPSQQDDDDGIQNVDFSSYMTIMKQCIQKNWHPPKGFESRKVVATFSILRNGNIIDESIVESSGLEAVDQSALAALRTASPLPALPLGAPKSVQIRYKFDWHVSSN